MDRFRVLQGAALQIDVTLRDAGGTVITTYTGSETLASVLWPGGALPTSATPSVAWLVAASGTLRVTIDEADTAALTAGRYELLVTLDDGTDVVEVYQARIDLDAAPLAAASITEGTPTASAKPAATSTAMACDEDLAEWDANDFWALAPRHQVLASGQDGVIDGAAPWLLSSASIDFEAQGVAPGHVLAILKPARQGHDLFAVAGVDGVTVQLRRIGAEADTGQPPATAAGLTSVSFEVRTYAPQLALSSADIRRSYRLATNSNRELTDLAEHGEELRQLCTLLTLRRAYLTSQKSADSDFSAKLGLIADQVSMIEARLSLAWGSYDAPSAPADNLFSTRARR
jgi:hypothetical protein